MQGNTIYMSCNCTLLLLLQATSVMLRNYLTGLLVVRVRVHACYCSVQNFDVETHRTKPYACTLERSTE